MATSRPATLVVVVLVEESNSKRREPAASCRYLRTTQSDLPTNQPCCTTTTSSSCFHLKHNQQQQQASYSTLILFFVLPNARCCCCCCGYCWSLDKTGERYPSILYGSNSNSTHRRVSKIPASILTFSWPECYEIQENVYCSNSGYWSLDKTGEISQYTLWFEQ